jgi:hypothetical protein
MTASYRILLDVPLSQNLALGFNELAESFRDVVENSDPQFAIGLYGSWGSGKTTLMEAIERKLDKSRCAVVWFSAWRYEKEQHLIVPLLDTVREGIVRWADANTDNNATQTAKKVAATVGKAVASLLAGFTLKAGIPGGPEISYDINKTLTMGDKFDELDMAARVPRSFYHASFDALRRAFGEFTGEQDERRIVVFVDDLDRCLPEGALEVLESMKLFFDIPGFVFVVGLDLRIVEASVAKRYREILSLDFQAGSNNPQIGNVTADVISGANYLRKIFQIPFTLPPVSTGQIQEFLQSIENTGKLPPSQWQEIKEKVEPHLAYLTDASGVNPREIKRFINAYTLVRKTKPFLDPGIVLALQTLAFRSDWRQIQFTLLTYRQVFIEALKRYSADPSAGSLEALGISLSTLPQSFATYLEQGKPGHVLISQTYDVSSYIYSGEATRSSVSIAFLDLFRKVGVLTPLIRKISRRESDRQELEDAIIEARGVLQSSDEAPRATVIVQELDALAASARRTNIKKLFSDMDEGPTDVRDRSRGDLRKFEEGAIESVQRIVQQLQQLYQAGTL